MAGTLVWFLPGRANAQGPVVTIPAGPFADGQAITVTGTGFPDPTADPTGLQIIECSDPGGTTANLPQDNSTCDAISISQGFISTDSSGSFSTQYTVMLLNSANSTINCDQSNFCVLWVGQDYLNQFTSGPHAFSTAFVFSGSTTTTTSVSTTTSSASTSTTNSSTTTSSSSSTTSPTTTTTSPTTTTTTPTTTTTTPTTTPSTTSTTTAAGGTTTSGPVTGGGSGDSGSGSGSGSSAVSANSGQLAFTGTPTVLPWLIGFGLVLTVLGYLGRKAIPRIPR